ncbi:hypothetical protein C491_10664 [Natronococcus amylolyticus DSM 10524]|uniref:Uncharacterized protein n=1 Tax=Natronococcus amylolyticus DSM 10524 TaxID=1227497 RepID=L9X897_9EURY|nr:hypothetical protein C491_10664 [Natronococcus amylolyticus DSM 10524]
MEARNRFEQIFRSRFDWVSTWTDGSLYPFDAVGIESAQHLGDQSTDPRVSISVSQDGYVVEMDD